MSSDPSAKLPNWFSSDFEKVLREVSFLNPRGSRLDHTRLPGETYHDVAQNPVAASSIGATEHTQVGGVCEGDAQGTGEGWSCRY